jgi:hypothetical protein
MPNMPNVPKYKIPSGPIANKFVALFRKIYEERLNGNPLFVFVVFLNTLIDEMPEMSILRHGLVNDKNRLIEMTKMNPSDTPAQINAKFVRGTNFMYEILNKIEMQKHLYKKVNKERMNDEDLLRIFYNIVSGGSELEKRQKRLQYGEWDWSQRGGKRKTLRRRKNRCMTRRK